MSEGDYHGYRAGTDAWALRDLQEAGGLLGWETDADGNLIGSINDDPRFRFDDAGPASGESPIGAAFRQYVDTVGGASGHRSAYIEARDGDPLAGEPYARLAWGYGETDEADGFIEWTISNKDNTTLLPVFRATIEGTRLVATGSLTANLELAANAGISLRSHSGDPNWVVDEIGVFRPYGPGNGLCLPVKAGAFSDEDYEYGIDGMVGIDTAASPPRLYFRAGEAWYYVAGTAV